MGRTAEVLFLREAIKYKLVFKLVSGRPAGAARGPAWVPGPRRQSSPGRRQRRSRLPARTRAPSALSRPDRPRRHLRGAVREKFNLKESLSQSRCPAPLPAHPHPPTPPKGEPRGAPGGAGRGPERSVRPAGAGDRRSAVSPVCILILKSGNGNCLMYEETLSN